MTLKLLFPLVFAAALERHQPRVIFFSEQFGLPPVAADFAAVQDRVAVYTFTTWEMAATQKNCWGIILGNRNKNHTIIILFFRYWHNP